MKAGELSVFMSQLKRDAVNEDSATRVRQYRDDRPEWMMKTGGANIVLEGLKRGTIGFAGEYE